MPPHRLTLIPLDGPFAIAKLPSDAAIPAWASSGSFFSMTRTSDELSIVCAEGQVPAGVQSEPGWRGVRVAGKMDFSMVGVLASLVGPLAEAGISVFAVSTFDTDYLLVKQAVWGQAKEMLVRMGHSILREQRIMATVTFITGLCGSGKSWLAQRLHQETGAELLDELEKYPTDEKKEDYLLSLLKQDKDCVYTDFRLMFADQRRRLVDMIMASCQGASIRWICFKNDVERANANVRNRPDKKDPEGHVALNERWSRRYTYPDQNELPGANIEIREVWNQDTK